MAVWLDQAWQVPEVASAVEAASPDLARQVTRIRAVGGVGGGPEADVRRAVLARHADWAAAYAAAGRDLADGTRPPQAGHWKEAAERAAAHRAIGTPSTSPAAPARIRPARFAQP